MKRRPLRRPWVRTVDFSGCGLGDAEPKHAGSQVSSRHQVSAIRSTGFALVAAIRPLGRSARRTAPGAAGAWGSSRPPPDPRATPGQAVDAVASPAGGKPGLGGARTCPASVDSPETRWTHEE